MLKKIMIYLSSAILALNFILFLGYTGGLERELIGIGEYIIKSLSVLGISSIWYIIIIFLGD